MDIILSILSLIVAASSFVLSWKNYKEKKRLRQRQENFQRSLQGQGQDFQTNLQDQEQKFEADLSSRIQAQEQNFQTSLQNQERTFEKQRLVVTLWDKIANVAQIQSDEQDNYDENDIFEALNILELVAICWDYELVDKNMIALAFGDSYIIRVEEIRSINKSLPELRKTGPQLLQERRSILNVKKKIEDHFENSK